MNDWFEWNGSRSTGHGVRVKELPPITVPTERVEFVDVPGKSGSLTLTEGDQVYDDMVLSALCYLERDAKIEDVAGWLKGGGEVEFANRPGGTYRARIVNQIAFETILRGNPEKEFTVNFRCKPFWYEKGLPPVELTTSGEFVTNPYTIDAEPVITVTGSGNISLMVGMTIMQIEGLSGGSIVLDTPLQEAYQGMKSMNNICSGEFPVLRSGANAVSWTGSVTQVTIQTNWRSL